MNGEGRYGEGEWSGGGEVVEFSRGYYRKRKIIKQDAPEPPTMPPNPPTSPRRPKSTGSSLVTKALKDVGKKTKGVVGTVTKSVGGGMGVGGRGEGSHGK